MWWGAADICLKNTSKNVFNANTTVQARVSLENKDVYIYEWSAVELLLYKQQFCSLGWRVVSVRRSLFQSSASQLLQNS